MSQLHNLTHLYELYCDDLVKLYSETLFSLFLGENEIRRRISTILLLVEENGTA